jgi:hypothetical protein
MGQCFSLFVRFGHVISKDLRSCPGQLKASLFCFDSRDVDEEMRFSTRQTGHNPSSIPNHAPLFHKDVRRLMLPAKRLRSSSNWTGNEATVCAALSPQHAVVHEDLRSFCCRVSKFHLIMYSTDSSSSVRQDWCFSISIQSRILDAFRSDSMEALFRIGGKHACANQFECISAFNRTAPFVK